MHVPILVRLQEGVVPIVMAAALGFALLGIALLADARGRTRRGGALAVLAIAVAGATPLLGGPSLGIDLPALHAWLGDGDPHPGRLGLNQALGFALAALIVLLNRPQAGAAARRAVLALIFGLLGVGLAGIVGHGLDLHLLDPDFAVVRMSLPTAAGFVVVALCCGLEWSVHAQRADPDARDSERQILLAGGALVALAAMSAGLAGIASQQRTLAAMLESGVQAALDSRIALFDTMLRTALQRAEATAREPELLRLVALHAAAPPTRPAVDALDRALRRLVATGYTGVRIDDADGRLLGSAGRLAGSAAFAAPLRSALPAELVWREQLLLRLHVPLVDSDVPLGTLLLETDLGRFDEDFFDTRGYGSTGEVLLCRAAIARNECFPGPARAQPFTIDSHTQDGRALPVSRALAGQRGVVRMRDYRGQHVLAAHAPLAPGLGVVLKQDAAELFQPVRRALVAALPWLLVLVAVGVYALRWHLRPMVRSLGDTLRHVAEQEARVSAVVDNVGDGILSMDERGTVLSCNAAACAIFDRPAGQIVGTSITSLMPMRYRDAHSADKLLPGISRIVGHGTVELVGLRGPGREFPLELRVTETTTADGRVLVAVLRDISERKEAQRRLVGMAEQMSHQAMHDALTGLANRTALEQRLDALLAESGAGAQHTLLFMDLDQFKLVNDTSGHAAGDELLRRLATVLRGALRASDLLARIGGDEFAVVLAGCDAEAAMRIAEALRARVRDFQFVWQERAFRIGVSIGAVPFAAGQLDRHELLRCADSACYVAKERGRNRVHLWHPDDADLVRRAGEMNWVARLQSALAQDRFVLYRQRIAPVASDGREPPRYELLLRLRDEAGELVPPMAFVPAAERYGLMASIDQWVVDRALAAMRAGGDDAHYAINLSGASLNDPAMLPFILEAIQRHGIAPRRLCFEVTETAAVANLDVAITMMGALRERGCQFALDDFGAGMSSFAYLQKLPVDYLKIDGRFVRDIADDTADLAMVEAINTLGHRLRLSTVAEFVEDERILALLRTLGVDYAQGYGIARPEPMPLDAAGAAAASPIQRAGQSPR
ncbi:EAL domain-containing protein [Aquabacterium humicola]|uniref:EAL domain-containing protein n=1 Tax=Aquabacterium humicola TaxID=3237377 RepID=UPI0025434439|nr:EAL domain-containing protein [Rubrivivax pictus]